MSRGNRSYRSSLGKFASLVAGGALCSACWLQQAHADEAAVLEEVTVTAQFRKENLQSTPIAITAVNAEMLEARSQTNVQQIANQSPNVTLKPA
ncbi:MAG TPA: hypothetical protein VL220_01725, partial [Steroidobacteraceae bacterium]|nr:hypothetical protein [Steroidobacteraceae bacterium]